MTALIYFGEMLVASLLAIVLLAISPFGMSYDAALLVAGVVSWTLAEYVVHRFVLHGLVATQHGLHQPGCGSAHYFLADMGLFRTDIFDSRRRLPCGRLNCLFMVPIRASLRTSRSR